MQVREPRVHGFTPTADRIPWPSPKSLHHPARWAEFNFFNFFWDTVEPSANLRTWNVAANRTSWLTGRRRRSVNLTCLRREIWLVRSRSRSYCVRPAGTLHRCVALHAEVITNGSCPCPVLGLREGRLFSVSVGLSYVRTPYLWLAFSRPGLTKASIGRAARPCS